ncbi:hypothetical protein BDP27DRAFT_1426128 [Rhodocollybia butyracea]|uniref:Uncharacterized protein n=1 Tax=Rhodocollybia butyracea TaxID=206335 RepID=A0A9P5U2R2_9AGAR|nr:hypothetical protein BDP27DRAFT_1426128 [Rhodocollybia butyracea]
MFLGVGGAKPNNAHISSSTKVTVGDDGSFYNPPTVAAGMNDIINFVFTGLGQHSVTQSSLATPCLPLEGGFNSGLTSLSNSTDPNKAPVWQLKITNASIPIYYFCTKSTPLSHCSAGMSNQSPSQEVYSSMLSLAKSTTSTVTFDLIPYAATGKGAVAQQTLALSSVGNEFLTARSSGTHTPTSTPSNNKKSDTGAIVGGAVGGALGAGLIVIGIVLLLLRRHRHASKNPPPQMYQQYYTPPPTAGTTNRGMSEHTKATPDSGTIPIPISPSPHQQVPPGAWRTGNEESPYSSNRNTGYTVLNPDDSSPLAGSNRLSNRSQNDYGTNIQTLAKEVAAVMLQNNTEVSEEGMSSGRQVVETTANNKVRLYHGSSLSESPLESPPQYQANE